MKVKEGNITAADGRITDEKRYIMKTEEKEDKRIYILSKEKPVKAVIKLGVPLIAGMFIMVLYNLVDTYFIGLMHDDYQLAAVEIFESEKENRKQRRKRREQKETQK